ncbi:MAG: peptidylprolyl isomerase [Polyangiaceae bacterium]|nr:peptidylprolyl isomerase [Polyangiaceae bacterium]
MSSLAIGPDTVVTLSYVLFDEHGEAVDLASEAEPLTYVHGYAQIVPGLERALEGMRAGERREIVVEPEDAFGEHEDSGVFEVDKADFEDAGEVELGDEFVAQGPDGEPLALRVVEILADAYRVDTNHPLAGQTVRFDVCVSDVRAASDDEIADAQAELEGRAQHDHEGCCGGHDHAHGHGDAAERLVPLSKKP